jgi:hypothetical protein
MNRTVILVMRYTSNEKIGLAYENVTIEIAGPLTLEIIQKAEGDTAKRLRIFTKHCKIHNVITLG